MVRRKTTASRKKSTTRRPIDRVKLAYAWRRAKNKSEANASSETKPRTLRTPKNMTFESRRKGKSKKKAADTSDSSDDEIFKQ